MARILIVDDDEMVRFTIREILESVGHDITEAENGLRVNNLHKADPFDVIITDIVMPEKEGFETIRELKRDDPNVPIIAISGGGRFKTEAYTRIASDLGADHGLNKPFDDEQLLKLVNTCLAP